ncbi:DUF3369 domain-containing protein [Chitinibacteraceae bacterium HSL-7]
MDDDFWLVDDTLPDGEEGDAPARPAWRVLIVDDEPDIHHVTQLALSHLDFLGQPLTLLSAYSGREALEMLAGDDSIAVMLLDVVMESEDAGLKVARAVREELHNHRIRIILRTGQPGIAPERSVLENFDINDYKAKTELTRDRLFTAVLGALRSYRDIIEIEHQRAQLDAHRRGLMKVIEATSSIFRTQSLKQFAQGVLEQLQALLFFEQDALYIVARGGLATLEQDGTVSLIHATGGYAQLTDASDVLARFQPSIAQAVESGQSVFGHDHFVGYFHASQGASHMLIVDGPVELSRPDQALIELFCRNVGIAFDNLMLRVEIEETQRDIIYQLSEVVENRSHDTGQHIRRMAEYAYLLARELGLSEQEAEIIKAASPLHDIGKVGIPDAVLHKPGRLDDGERTVMNQHAELGYEMLKHARPRILQMAALIAQQHHERWDGTGYPNRLAGNDIHLAGRIIALADVYDALSNARCYKHAWPRDEVLAAIRNARGTQFDPAVVDAFFRILPEIEQVAIQCEDGAHHPPDSG